MKYEFIGWERDAAKNIDKVWGVICIGDSERNYVWDDGKYVAFWGRRGKKLSTLVHTKPRYEMKKLWEKKHSDGYTKIDESRLAEVYPEFQDDLEKTAVWALLSN
jgi:hypothetical protein